MLVQCPHFHAYLTRFEHGTRQRPVLQFELLAGPHGASRHHWGSFQRSCTTEGLTSLTADQSLGRQETSVMCTALRVNLERKQSRWQHKEQYQTHYIVSKNKPTTITNTQIKINQ